ncbi:fungal-specific transcription factor domain-containing protein [Dactylonectria macrodidyma]|uniref:Fungal-specific transcription factor domain-containing protein n=1 Tax=Dactylonectria macrodidyma TaxID=307937 RepID=A0A9P9EFM3_9HYPO|nr:fungal-specific transcription factor domain-containing protein [Dactylonectria macrodidyma]
MTPTPPSTNSSQGGRSPEEQFRVVRKRNRVPLSCHPCRTRKLKCDRSHPCSNCTKREGMGTTSCSYATPVARKKNQSQGDSSPDDMQNRIDRLEGLVLSLMHGGANVDAATAAAAAATTQSTTDSGSSAKVGREDEAAMVDDDEESDTEEGLAASLGFLKVDTDKGKSLYVGQEHWHTILADISEVKNYFNSHKKELESSYERVMSSKPMAAREGPTLLFGAIPASEIEIRAELPPKSSVLALCGRYFNSMDNAVNIIHGPTFQKQLRVHWQDPSKTPIMWLGLLYSILCLAMLSYHKVGDEPPEWKGRTLELANEYRLRTVQCLIKSDYTKPVEYTVETMILYVFGEYSSRWDADLGLWLIISLITRIAFRMGYHRDAKWFPSLTPFQAEMRRRTWALVRMSDVIFSHQVSLPSMIYEHDCDTQLPNNVFDDEFHPDIKAMPPSRPPTEPTPIAYMIAKSRLCNELGNILQATNRVGKHVPYDEIIRFDAKLRQVMQELPPHLKLTSLESSHDPVTLIIARFNVDILYQKILCLLHRKYLPRARQSARYAHSRRSAIDASLQALDHLAILHRESKTTGRLRSVHWYVKSIATKDFILPAMLVILDLHFDNIAAQTSVQPEHEGTFRYTEEQRSRMIESLETAREIWKTLADSSMEAYKATKIIEIMLEKIIKPEPGGDIMASIQSEPMQDLTSNMGIDPSPSMDSSMISPSGLSEFNTGMNPFSTPNTAPFMGMDFGLSGPEGVDMQTEGFGAGPASPFSSMFNNMGSASSTGIDLNTNFDWNAFENYTQVANWGADQSFQIYGAEGDPSSPNKSSISGGAGGSGTGGGGGSSAGGGGGVGGMSM